MGRNRWKPGDRVCVTDGALGGECGTVRGVGWMGWTVEVEFDNVSVPVWLRATRLAPEPKRER